MKKVGVGCFKKEPLGVKLKIKNMYKKKQYLQNANFNTNSNSGLIWIMTTLNCSYICYE